ncbi:MAG: ABC transporter substrate-binding protein [Phycisphaerales bacterium]|nr:ABC transporter substrate-binding protein [Phycisphaerales bacterium]
MDSHPLLTLAHSPDPDDVFMWWPITGKIAPDGSQQDGPAGLPTIPTGRFRYRAFPADIEVLNRRAAGPGDLDITALSFRAYADVRERYILTACGSSFGDGYGPKLIAARDLSISDLREPALRIAVPGRHTTAFLTLGLLLGRESIGDQSRFLEMPFEQIIPAVAAGRADAGLVIHEGQLTFIDAGLRLIVDLGAWWKQSTGLPLPLGANAVRRDLDSRYGPGSVAEVAATLRRSIDHAMRCRAESVEYTLPFALANVARAGNTPHEPTIERVDRYISMYVNDWTVDMGEAGREALRRLFAAGAEAGLSPDAGLIETA